MERDRRCLERDTTGNHHDPDPKHAVEIADRADLSGDIGQQQRARRRINQADPKRQHGRGDRTDKEVFQTGLDAATVVLEIRDKSIRGQRRHLQADKDGYQRVRHRHQPHRCRRQQQQRVERCRGGIGLEVVVAGGDNQRGDAGEDSCKEQPQTVDDDRPAKEADRTGVGRLAGSGKQIPNSDRQRGQCAGDRCQRQQLVVTTIRTQAVDTENNEAGEGEQNNRQ